MPKFLTPEGFDKLKKEIDYLQNVKRKEIAEKLKHAIAFGDLRENAAYHDAKDAQGFLERRIIDIKKILSDAKIIENKSSKEIQLGSTALLSFDGEEQEFQIVGPEEANILKGKISFQSPLGKILVGKKKGDTVDLQTPAGTTRYTVKEIR